MEDAEVASYAEPIEGRGGSTIELIGGPWHASKILAGGLPPGIAAPGGRYLRSTERADDGAARYHWNPSLSRSAVAILLALAIVGLLVAHLAELVLSAL
jgi:hypothetical protein